jgi:hypothetical protein
VHPAIRSLDGDDAAVDSESTDLTGRRAPLSTVPS